MILDRNSFGFWGTMAKRAFKARYVRPSDEYARKRVAETLIEKDVAAYIHIPYCTGTCLFCPYARFPIPRSELDYALEKYFSALLKEIREYGRILKDHDLRIVDIHAGGGTPSLVPGKYWRAVMEELSSNFDVRSKLAIEANPEDLRDEARAFDLIDSGVAELSLGVQSFNAKALKTLGRRHSVQDSIKAVENVRKAGVRHVNIDLMYMIPGQTINEWVSDLEHAASLDVDEITCYPTLIVEYSLGYRMIKEGKLPEQPEANEFKKMMYACEDILPERGYRGLEIYGYSRVEDWKYVTVNYEMEGPLIAFGAGAMGFTGEYEYQNICYPEQYGKQVSAGKLPIAFSRDVSPSERAVRYITCRLFICRVLDKGEFRRKFGEEFGKIIEDTGFKWPLRMLKISRDVVEDRKEVKLTRKGLFTAHKVCWSFVLNVPCRMVEKCLTKPCPEVVTIPD